MNKRSIDTRCRAVDVTQIQLMQSLEFKKKYSNVS